MLLGWLDLIRRPFNKRNDFVSVDAARGYSNNNNHNAKNYEMITSPPTSTTTYAVPKMPDAPFLVSSPTRPEREERPLRFPHSPPSPSSQYTNDYFGNNGNNNNKEVGGRHLSFSLPREADYKSPKLSFSTPRPPSAGRSFSSTTRQDSYGRYQQPTQTGRMSPGRALSPSMGRESAGSTFSSAYDWDPMSTYAPPTTTAHVTSYSRPDAF